MGKIRKRVISEINKYSSNQLIMMSKFYRNNFSSFLSETAFYKLISRLYISGEIYRVSKGIYCKANQSKYGKSLLQENEVVETYTKNEKGILIGYQLYNQLGITTQVSKRYIIYSSSVDKQNKNIGNVNIHRYNLIYNNATKSMICILELLYNYRNIQDLNISCYINEIKRLSKEYNEKVFENVQKEIKYPKWVIAFLQEVLNYYQIPNDLKMYLSSLSKYNIPKMSELYEFAQ